MKIKALWSVFLIFIIICLTGCIKRLDGSFCVLYQPVYYSIENDTKETIEQIRRNNVVYDECKQSTF